MLGNATTPDLGFGWYDLEADYQFDGGSVAGKLGKEMADNSATIDFKWTTWTQIRLFPTGLLLGGMYITDMPTIQHNAGSQVAIGTGDVATMNAMVEILLEELRHSIAGR